MYAVNIEETSNFNRAISGEKRDQVLTNQDQENKVKESPQNI